MQITIFASGSTGNCSAVYSGQKAFLIDAGISCRRICKGLSQVQIGTEDMLGVLVTHEHTDHISGLPMLTKKLRLPIYTTHAIASRIYGKYPETEPFIKIIEPEKPFNVEGFEIRAFRTPHDSFDSVGFRIEKEGILGFATDTGHITEEMLNGLAGADTAVIEANHDERMLKEGFYPVSLKRRILSEIGHLSNDNSAILAKMLAESGTKRIILGHISMENNTPGRAMRTVSAALEGEETELYAAPETGCLTVKVGEESICRV